jgi:hypothetical protein
MGGTVVPGPRLAQENGLVRHNVTVYKPADRPDVEVLVDDEWLPGEARMRWQEDSGTWWYQVSWRPAATHTRRLDNFPTDRLRQGPTAPNLQP